MGFDLLTILVAHPGRVFARIQLVEQPQEGLYVGYDRTIDVHIKNLRQKLGYGPKQPSFH